MTIASTPTQFLRNSIIASLLAFACATNRMPRIAEEPPVDAALTRRADSLIARLLDTPGEFRGDGHVYGFFTDQHLLDDLSALNMHAARSLIECMSDGRKSKVRYDDRDTREPRRALRGALCFEALVHTYFYQMRDDSLFRRALLASDCDEHADEGPKYCYASYSSDASELRRAQRVWRAYLAASSAEHRPVPPRLAKTAVGCYELQLHANHPGELAVDTVRRIAFELDSLPFPGTVRPSTLELSPQLRIGGRARWNPHYEIGVLVTWSDSADRNGLNVEFQRTDGPRDGYVLFRSDASTKETFGDVVVRRLPCSGR